MKKILRVFAFMKRVPGLIPQPWRFLNQDEAAALVKLDN